MDCKVNKPYPQVQVERKNIEYAKLLLDDYAGIVGEMTAINQYVYQKFDKFNVDPVFAKTMSSIAAVEMTHLQLLGETIKLLGVNPEFRHSEKNLNKLSYWDSSNVDYTTDIVEMLKSDIRIEEEAIKKYRYHISIINDQYIRNLLYRIIEDEQMHIRCFNMLLNRVLYGNSYM